MQFFLQFFLNSDVSRDSRIEFITGDVNLILGDGHTLDVKGLYVPAGSALSCGYMSAKNGYEARRNLGKALYLYNQTADAKFGS